MKPGDVYWVDLPAVGGHVQQGRRPAIIWQDSAPFPNLPTRLVIPLTSQQSAVKFGPCHLIQPSARNGLSVPSVALVFQLTTLDRRWVGTKVGELDDADLARLKVLASVLQGLP